MTRSTRRGFTLVELLIVVALIAIVSGMVVGLFGSAVEKSGATVSMATQKQLVNQVNAYMQLHNQTFPDRYDSLIRTDHSASGVTYASLATGLSVASDPAVAMGQPGPVIAGATGTDAKTQNRGVHPDMFTGATRSVTVMQLTVDDIRTLNNLGITTLCDHNGANFSYGELQTTDRLLDAASGLGVGTPICIVDPQGLEGQRLYKDFGVDLSDATAYPKQTSDDTSTAWDDTGELTTAARLSALQKQRFFVLGVGIKSKLVGDGLAGVQEVPVSPVVPLGYYKYFSLAIKRGALGGNDRTGGLAGVIDPRGRGVTAARQVVNSIQ